jgi:HEAT repeat protein
MRRHLFFTPLFFWLMVAVSTVMPYQAYGDRSESQVHKPREENKMSSLLELERMLREGSWRAVELAQQLSDAAWPAIRKGASMPDYRSRQIAMTCAGRIGGGTAGLILAQGLSDENVNVRVTAAAQLSANPPATAKAAILDTLLKSSESDIREMLALAAGYLPGKSTMDALRSLAGGKDAFSKNARMALAKLGDPEARKEMISNLSAKDPHVRYETLGQLRYVDDRELSKHAKDLLWDKASAQRIGPERNPRFRRVCDQAVDTLVYLMKLSPPFITSVETIYSDDQLLQISQMAP